MASVRGSVKSGALGHNRHDSISGSIGPPIKQPQSAASRRNSDWTTTEVSDQKENVDIEDGSIHAADPPDKSS